MLKLITTSLTIFVVHAVISKWARRREDSMIKWDYLIANVDGNACLHICLVKCQMTAKCQSVSWYQDNKTCLLYKKNVIDDYRDEFNKWIALAKWKTYSKVEYPVVRRLHPDKDNSMNFDLAVPTCIDQYSTIATPDDLLEARRLGMDNCFCGWMSNGRKGFVTPEADSCPSKGYSTDIIYCNMTGVGAWCKLW